MRIATSITAPNKNSFILFILTGVLCALFWAPFFAGAQSSIEEIDPIKTDTTDESCFDYYSFGSVEVDVQSNLSQTASGGAIHFGGNVVNNNPYPIVDGAVYVKVFRKQDDTDKVRANGHHIVDQFFAVENIAIPANDKTPVSFSWNVPTYAISGDYKLTTYFVTSKKFNLLGLSFTDDIAGNSFDFQVNGEQTGGVFFDKNSSVVGGLPNNLISSVPRVSKTEPIEVSINVSNTLDHAITVPLVWTLYYWDGLLEEHIIDSKTEEISIDANKSLTVSYKVNDATHAVYYLVGKVQYNNSSSFINTRLVREGVPEVRVNFPSFIKYPIEKDVPNVIFSCLHGAGLLDVVENGKLEVFLETPTGQEVDSFVFEGPITGSMMVKTHEFIPRATYDNLVLKTNLFLKGVLVDTTRIEYRCEEINPTHCISGTFDESASRTQMLFLIMIGFVGVVAIAGSVLWCIKKHEGMRSRNGKKILVSVLLCFIFTATFFSIETIPTADASKSTTWTSLLRGRFQDFILDDWRKLWVNTNVQVTYQARVRDAVSGLVIPDGASIPVGTQLIFEPVPHEDTDISFVGVGYIYDTPFGYWRANATAPATECLSPDYVDSYFTQNGNAERHLYGYLSIDPPTITVSHDGSALDCPVTTTDCTVVSEGPIESTFTFNETWGKFYGGERLEGNVSNINFVSPTSPVTTLLNNAEWCAGGLINFGVTGGGTYLFDSEPPASLSEYAGLESGRCISRCYSSGNPLGYGLYTGGFDPDPIGANTNFTLDVPSKNIDFSFTAVGSGGASPPDVILNATEIVVSETDSLFKKFFTLISALFTRPTSYAGASIQILNGKSVLLTWTVQNAQSCSGSMDQGSVNGWEGEKNNFGGTFPTEALLAVGSPYTFKLTCTNMIGSNFDTVNVTVTGNSPPTPPTISGPTTGVLVSEFIFLDFIFSATDPDGDKIRYGVDWNNDGERDKWYPYPSSNYIVPEPLTGSRGWQTEGIKTFKAYTEDEHGATSGWVSYNINITLPPAVGEGGDECTDGVDNDGDGYCDTVAGGSCIDESVPGDPGCINPITPGIISESNCGNNICEAYTSENPITCPIDCAITGGGEE